MNDQDSLKELITRKLGREYDLSTSALGKTKALKKLREMLSSEVEALLEKNQMLEPPFDPSKIREIGNAKIRFESAPRNEIGADGCLRVTQEGFLIKVDKTLVEIAKHKHRLRSTMSHELMHVFFYDTTTLPPLKPGRCEQSRKHFLIEEELCYYLSRVFLMPTFSVFRQLSKDKSLESPSLRNLDSLKSKFIVSSDIVAYRMIIDLSIWDSIFVKFLEEGALFRSKTTLKSKTNRLYRRLIIPKYIPEQGSRNEWIHHLSDHIINTTSNKQVQELIPLGGQMIALESRVETSDPLSIVTIVYQED